MGKALDSLQAEASLHVHTHTLSTTWSLWLYRGGEDLQQQQQQQQQCCHGNRICSRVTMVTRIHSTQRSCHSEPTASAVPRGVAMETQIHRTQWSCQGN